MLSSRSPVPVYVFSSGQGSNFDSICEAVESGQLNARVLGLISDQENAPVHQIAKKWGVPSEVVLFPKSQGLTLEQRRQEFSNKLLKAVEAPKSRFIILAGFMRILSSSFIQAFRSDQGYFRIVNIHPSLLPAFPGVHGYRQAWEYGVKLTGVTVHLVDEVLDAGPICHQESFPISGFQSLDEFCEFGKKLENRMYPHCLEWILQEKFTVYQTSTGRFRVHQN